MKGVLFMKHTISNSRLSIAVDTFGAELKSLKRNSDGREYMWDAKPEYWKRTSPVLFPIVGSLNEGQYHYNGNSYEMSQHGFARDKEFELVSNSDDELKFVLKSDSETKAKYPFDFELEIGYKINDENVTVSWFVKNKSNKDMYFSIGGHPAFRCPVNENDVQTDYKLKVDAKEVLLSSVIGKGGTLTSRKKAYALNDGGYMNITDNLFDDDALIIEDHQAHEVSLCTPDKEPYITVSFDAPLFGIWSPTGKNAPFVCIEPWYGRCDRTAFKGDLSKREWGNTLTPGETFNASYNISIN
jgi:galactose mutarotase-like enzyme